VGEDRTGRVYAHPATSPLVNQTFFAGLPYTSFGAENLTGRISTTRLRAPRAVALNDSGGVIFSDEGHDRRLFEAYPASGIVRAYGIYPDGVGTHQPAAAVFDPVRHNVVASDFGGGRLLRFLGTGGFATIIAGLGTVAGDTTVAFASVGTPAEIALAPGGDIFFADPSSHRVRKLTGDGHVVTVIGTGVQGAGGDGSGAGTQLDRPSGVALDPATQRLYVGDTGNDRVLAFDLGAAGVPLLSTTAVPAPGSLALTHALGGALLIASGNQVLELALGGAGAVVAAGGGGYGPAAGANLGTQQVLLAPSGLTPDGADGLLFADPLLDLVFHLQANGQIAVAAGVPAGMTMGSQALWFGADAASDPAEVAGWVQPAGYGNNWSQRVLSPPISLAAHPHARLSFDAALDLGEGAAVQPVSGGEFVLVQALKTDGGWTSLAVRLLGGGAPSFPIRSFAGRGLVHVTADLDTDGNDLLGLAAPTRLRLVVQTSERGSNEDGRTANTRGAAVVDNLHVEDPGGPVVAPTDFEAGGTGDWTLAALNGVTLEQDCLSPASAAGPADPGPVQLNCPPYTRDLAPPNTVVQLSPGFDAQD
ncbi:MAG TPA: hypothetical protein VEP73_04895, partial [Actinomycetota bacterium]|nr:hypothetical protein [Actinomycetota bacterium]